MRKIIAVLLVCAMMVPMVAFDVQGSESGALTGDYVIDELQEAYSFLVAYGGFKFFDILSGVITVEVDSNDTVSVSSGSSVVTYERSVKLRGNSMNSDSNDIVCFDVSTRDDLVKVLKNHYTEAAAEELIASFTDDLATLAIKNDALYVMKDVKSSAVYKQFPYSISDVGWVDKIEVNGNDAVASVYILVTDKSFSTSEYMHIPVSFKLVDGEWRIAENVFFEKIFDSSASSYIVNVQDYKTPMTPALDGDVLSLSDISWLVEASNGLLMALSNGCSGYYSENPYGVSMHTSYDFDGIKPYSDSDKPEYIKKSTFGQLEYLSFMRPLFFDIKIESEADFFGYVGELFTKSAGDDFINLLVNRMNVLYFSDGNVYVNLYDFRDEADMTNIIKVNDVKSIEYSGNEATAQVELLVQPRYSFDKEIKTVQMEFEKTENGWRISCNPYGTDLHSDYVDALPDSYRDAFPEICVLPDLSGTLTKETAQALAEKAYRTYTIFNYGTVADIRVNDKADPYYEDYRIIRKKISSSLLYYGDVDDDLTEYRFVDSEREFDFLGRTLGSLDDVKAMLSDFVTENVADHLLTYTGDQMVFRQSLDGRLLMHLPKYGGYYYIDSFGSFIQSENTATLEVLMIKQGNANDDVENKEYIEGLWDEKATVTFQKTSDGWRISGGTMFSLLYGDSYTEQAPATADVSPLLAFLAIVSLSGIYTVSKKRRAV